MEKPGQKRGGATRPSSRCLRSWRSAFCSLRDARPGAKTPAGLRTPHRPTPPSIVYNGYGIRIGQVRFCEAVI